MQLGKAIGVSQSTIALWENGETNPRSSHVGDLSSALRSDPEYLIYGVRSAESAKSASGSLANSGAVTAFIGEDQILHRIEPSAAKALGRVAAIEDLNDEWSAAVVRGDFMLPQHRDKDILFYRKPRRENLRDWLGFECVVWDEDGRAMVKRLASGSTKQLFTLVGPNLSEIRDVRLKQVAPIEAIKRFIPR